MQMVILAGGLGTRLGEISKKTPKSMIRIFNKPFLQHQIELLREKGISKILLCIGAKIFLESLGHKPNEFLVSYTSSNQDLLKIADDKISKCEKEMRVKNKGSLFQYLRYFPKDDFLNYWSGIVKLEEGHSKEAKKLFNLSKISKERLIYNSKK